MNAGTLWWYTIILADCVTSSYTRRGFEISFGAYISGNGHVCRLLLQLKQEYDGIFMRRGYLTPLVMMMIQMQIKLADFAVLRRRQ